MPVLIQKQTSVQEIVKNTASQYFTLSYKYQSVPTFCSARSSSSSGSCAITETNRGCKKCRYERCLAAGMKTNMVRAELRLWPDKPPGALYTQYD